MARKFVPNGQKVKCSFGKGETAKINISRPSTTKLHDEIWATTADKEITPFDVCSCPTNASKKCLPLLQEWLPNTVAINVKNGGNNFLLGSSQNTCIANVTFIGLVEIDLEEANVSKDAQDFAKNNPTSNEGEGSSSSPTSNQLGGGGAESEAMQTTDSSTDDSSWRDLEEGKDIKDDLIAAANKKTEEEKQQTQDYIDAGTNRIDEGHEIERADEASIEEAIEDANRLRAEAIVLDHKSENPDPTVTAELEEELEAGMPEYSLQGSLGAGVGYVEGAVKEGIIDPVVGAYKLSKGIATSLDDIGMFYMHRDPVYLIALQAYDPDRLEERLVLNQIQDDALWERVKNLPKEAKDQYVKDYKEIGRDLQSGDDQVAGKAAGKGVVKTIFPLKKVIKMGSKIFNKDFMKELNLKSVVQGAKGELLDHLTGNIYSKLPYMGKIKEIMNSAKTYKNKIAEIKGVLKSFNEGAHPSTYTKTPAPVPSTKTQGDTTNDKANDPKNSQEGSQKTNKNSICKGDPVDVVTGVNIYDYVDFEIPGTIPIHWKRIWYSDSAYKGSLGHGVHYNYDIHLTTRSEDILLTLGDGRLAFFSLVNEKNKSEFNRAEKLKLTYVDSSNYHLFDYEEQLTYVLTNYSGSYKLSRIIKDEHTSVQFNYQGNNLKEIVDTAGRLIKIHHNDDNKIIKITQHHQSEERTLVTYEYNKVGDLTKITDATGKSVIAVYKNHLMISKTHREGATCFWEYESYNTGARCTRTWLEGGTLDYSFEYHDKYNYVWDSYGHKTTYYHENNIPVKIVDPLGGITTKEYNEFGELIKTTDQEGLQTQYKYDDFGNETSIRYPDGANVEFAYDDEGHLLLQTSPEGGILSRYFKNNKLDTIMYPDQTMQTFEYNESGLVSKIADANENTTHLFYDEDHNLNRMVSPNGEESFWEYNAWGQCIKTINPAKHQQLFSYDPLGNVSTIRLPDKNAIQLEYDSYGRVRKAIDNERILTYEYTSQGNLKSRKQDGRKVLFRYNKEEQLIGVINEHKEAYNFTRDAMGNIIKEEGFDYISRGFIRDKAGKVIKEEKSNDKFSIYEYDKGGRVSRVEYHDNSWATFDYNKDGLLIQAVNPNSHVKINRDEAGRVLSEDQDGHTISYDYNDEGQQSKIKSSLGASIDLKYTDLGEISSVKAKNQHNNIWKANFKYNSLGMETERSLPGGIKASWSYDHAGRHKQQVIKKQEVQTRRRTYSWDVNHKLRKIVDNLSQGVVTFDYDDFKNLAWAQYEDKSYDYKLPDEVGNLYRTKEKKDREYGRNGQLLTSGNNKYEYDDEGNLIKKSSPKGIWKYDWAANGILKSIYRPDRSIVEIEYDALGRRTAKVIKQCPSKKSENNPDLITRFVWNGNTPLHEWNYKLKDRPQSIINETDQLSINQEEPIENLITWVFDHGTFKLAAKITKDDTYSIITDHLGTPVEMYNSKGEKTWHAEYDIYGKIRNLVTGSLNDCPFRFQGQYEDSEIDLYYNRFRYYNPEEGIYISQDPIRLAGNNPTMYAYTHDTNGWVDPFGLNNIKTGSGRDHVTYEGIKNGKPYVGYASAPSSEGLTSAQIISRRYSANFNNFGGIPPESVYEGSGVRGRNTAKGLEQQIYETNVNKYGKKGVANIDNPVSERNPKKDVYARAADRHCKKTKPS
ncbi:DUF6531 domain-containing protein [uncultured Aquimarina sp.]|uniref:DUF6531 domain-containing protein n=1 Tax=uncultured Aquimarina sp. TaxID=575652 RepID=UPI002633C2FB|nr:DUF6531 domain-containing protein [uncultured Aquimarina sp.]